MRYHTLVICALFVFEGEALMCIKCDSKDPQGLCRRGKGKHHTKHYTQSCYGKNYGKSPVTPKCYTAALINENGESYFERGCTLETDICSYEYDDPYLEYCQTCTGSYCNNDEVILEQEVEQYPKEHTESIIRKPKVSPDVIEYKGNDDEKLQVLTSTTANDDGTTIMTNQLTTTDADTGWGEVSTNIEESIDTTEAGVEVLNIITTETYVNSTNNVEDSKTE